MVDGAARANANPFLASTISKREPVGRSGWCHDIGLHPDRPGWVQLAASQAFTVASCYHSLHSYP